MASSGWYSMMGVVVRASGGVVWSPITPWATRFAKALELYVESWLVLVKLPNPETKRGGSSLLLVGQPVPSSSVALAEKSAWIALH